MLTRVVRRVRAAERVAAVVVATTKAPADDAIAELALAHGWLLTRGSEDDVLDRYWHAAQEHDAELILRVCSDCPMTAPDVIDRVIAAVADDANCDYAANNFEPATYPKGLDVEAFTRAALEDAWQHDDRPEWREHVTPFIRRHPERFQHTSVADAEDHSDLRWTVDTPDDLALMRCLVAAAPADADWRTLVAVQRAHPEWAQLNQHIQQRRVPS
jgi:spore coat polysaccharide biosynthesis protein SpsF (cytidylyltransferase family)